MGHFLKYSELGCLVNILYIGSRNKVTEHFIRSKVKVPPEFENHFTNLMIPLSTLLENVLESDDTILSYFANKLT